MSSMQNDLRTAEEAAEWLMRLSEEDSTACKSAFFEWVRKSPGHVQAFLEASEMALALDGVDRGRQIDVDALLAAAPTNVVALDRGGGEAAEDQVAAGSAMQPTAQAAAHRRTASRRRRTVAAAAAIVSVMIAAIVSVLLLVPRSPNQFSVDTAIGEQRTLKLPDGSLVTLNTRSRLAVDLQPRARAIRLLSGEALFSVAPDTARPFTVTTPDATVRAIGTQFGVYRSDRGTTVSVLEGRVQVFRGASGAHASATTPLSAGEEARITHDGGIHTRALREPAKTLAWRERRLEFHETPLEEVVAEFNRYNTLQLRVAGPMDTTKQISGIFNADNPQALLQFLQRDRSLAVEREGGTLVIRER